jgi:hypothetical protein
MRKYVILFVMTLFIGSVLNVTAQSSKLKVKDKVKTTMTAQEEEVLYHMYFSEKEENVLTKKLKKEGVLVTPSPSYSTSTSMSVLSTERKIVYVYTCQSGFVWNSFTDYQVCPFCGNWFAHKFWFYL